MKQLFYQLLDFHCLLCQTPLYQKQQYQTIHPLLCDECRKWFYREIRYHCKQCGESIDNGTLCPACSAAGKSLSYDDYRFIQFYEQWCKHLVMLHKKQERHEILTIYGELLTDSTLSSVTIDKTIPVTFVPDSWWARWKKGRCCFSGYLSRYLKHRGYLVIDHLLKRSPFSRKQKLSGKKQRLQNAEKSFQLRNKNNSDYQTIQLIDDIYTTGATIQRCAVLLKEAGFSQVNVITIFKSVTKKQ